MDLCPFKKAITMTEAEIRTTCGGWRMGMKIGSAGELYVSGIHT